MERKEEKAGEKIIVAEQTPLKVEELEQVDGRHLAVLHEGMDVEATDGKVGDLRRTVINVETKEMTHIVVDTGILFGKEILVPIDYVSDVREAKIHLNRDKESLKELPEYEAVAVSSGFYGL